MLRRFAQYLGILLLAFPVVAYGAFFFGGEATFPVLKEEISCRDDSRSTASFENVSATSEGWVSQRKKAASRRSEPRRFEEASILFTDFLGFTVTVSTIPPKRLVQELDEIFRGFDDIMVANGLEKIKTIDDACMAAGGLPVAADNHALRCVRAGLALTQFIETRNQTAAMKWGLRVGVHSGAVVAGIVGKNKYAYDVWDDTVNIASRLESASEVNKVNISAYTFELVQAFFECEYRGKLAAKGKGEIDMYFVRRERIRADVKQTAG